MKKWSLVPMLMFAVTSAFAGQIRIDGGAAPMENIFKKIKEPFEKASGTSLVLASNGPDQAFKALDKGEIDLAAGGVTLADWFDLMEKSGYAIANKAEYKSRVIGRDKIQVIANKNIGVSKLSKEQLKGLFTGTIKNWKEVGGADQSVTIVMGSKITGTNKVFAAQMMDKQEFTKTGVKEVTDAPSVKDAVAGTPGAVGIVSMGTADASVASPATPEVGRPITAITKGAPSADVQKLFDFIRTDGQKYVVQ